MERLTRAMAAAEREVAFADAELTDIENLLEQALKVAGSCWLHYEAAPPFVRRQMNQGFFEKLWIGQDGSVDKAEMTAPFEALQGLTVGEDRLRDTEGHDPVTDRGPVGSHNGALVELRGFEPLTP
jgi:site-specific DNA recombinase